MEDNSKTISISGIHNKRQIKNLNSEPGAIKIAKKTRAIREMELFK